MIVKLNRFPDGKSKAFIMSYDDGTIHDRKLIEIFNKYNIKGTFHLNSSLLDKEGFITSDEIKDLYKGHEAAVHTVNHLDLTCIPIDIITKEIHEDRVTLESIMKYPIKGFAYPYGTFNDLTVKLLPSLGIEYARTTKPTYDFCVPDNFYSWHPTCHQKDNLLDTMERFLAREKKYGMAVMKVWGHSYEYDRDNNWEDIEEFCRMYGNIEDIWYTTSSDFVMYIKAINNLRFSASGNIVHNISAIDVWISVDDKPIKVQAGSIIEI